MLGSIGSSTTSGLSNVREYTYAYAALSPHDGVLDSLVLPDSNKECMGIFLEEVSRRHFDEKILMVMDGAAWHRAKTLRIPNNIELIIQPPYSPELNPVEHLWDEIREKWFRNYVFKSMTAVERKLVDALNTLEDDRDRIKNIAGFKWIINI